MEIIRDIFEEFNSTQVQENWLPYLIILNVIFLYYLLQYWFLIRGKFMDRILYVHNFITNENGDSSNSKHFHNTDLMNDNFDLKKRIFMDGFEWIGRHYLFINSGRLNTLTKKGSKLTVWYNSHSPKGIEYKVKRLPKNWKERRLSKLQLTNYNGTFIMQNLMVKTYNLTSLEVDCRDKNEFVMTYLFDNGSKKVLRVPVLAFFEDITNTIIPYNISFLDQCEVIELK